MGEATHHVRQQWEPNDGERLYGLGQHQQGLVDIKGTDLELRQYNSEIFIPLLVSSRGYGILWDNTSLSRFGRTEPPVLAGVTGDLRAGRRPARRHTRSGTVNWSGTVTVDDRRLPLPHLLVGRTSSCSRQPDRHRSLAAGLAAQRGHRPREADAPARACRLRFRWKADIGVNIVRLLSKPPVTDRDHLAVVPGGRRRRLLLRLRARDRHAWSPATASSPARRR